jgi:transcriptional regulator with XRE-family HTH domain
MAELNLSPSVFADTIGVKRASVSHILSGRNNPSLDFVQKILAKYPALNPDWILSGSGNIWREGEMLDNVTNNNITTKSREAPKLAHLFKDTEEQKSFSTKTLASKSVDTRQKTDRIESKEKPKEIPAKEEPSSKSGKKVVKVIILYNDNTFEAFTDI